jgi:hypothetical protein
MAELIAARDWLTVCQLPPYARELNPVEPVWSHLKRSLTNMAKRNLLLELDRRHRGHRAEVAVERRDTHRGQRREFLDAQRLVVVTADPADRAGQVREPAVGQPDLPHGRPLRSGDQPPQDLALDAGRQRGGAVSSSSAAILSGRSSSTKARNGSPALACAMCPITGRSTDTMRNYPAP